MTTLDELTSLLANHRGDDISYQEAYDALISGVVRFIGTPPYKGRASSLLKTWQIRDWTTRRAGISTSGFESSLHNLALRPPDEAVLGWALDGSDRVYIIFAVEVSENQHKLMGCIRVMKSDPAVTGGSIQKTDSPSDV